MHRVRTREPSLRRWVQSPVLRSCNYTLDVTSLLCASQCGFAVLKPAGAALLLQVLHPLHPFRREVRPRGHRRIRGRYDPAGGRHRAGGGPHRGLQARNLAAVVPPASHPNAQRTTKLLGRHFAAGTATSTGLRWTSSRRASST